MKNDQDIFLVIVLLILDNFLFGAGFDLFTILSVYLSFIVLAPRYFQMVLPKKIVLITSCLFGVCSLLSFIIHGVNGFHTVTLEGTFLIRFVVLISLLVTPISFNPRQVSILKYLMLISLGSMFFQCLHSYIYTGTGMLLRADRNHSAVIITSFFVLYHALFGKKSLFSLFFVVTNFSRNLVIGLMIFFSEHIIGLDKFTKRKYVFLISIVVFLNSIFYLYGYVLEHYFTGVVGSSNDLSRLFVVFDGSNTLRFKLNFDFLQMIGDNFLQFLIFTGKYSELKDVLGLYPHNSYLHLVYRVGVIRAVLLLLILMYFIKSHGALLAFTIFLFQAAFIHEMFLNSTIILLCFTIGIFNQQEATNEGRIRNRGSGSSSRR